MKKILGSISFILLSICLLAQPNTVYKVVKTYPVAGEGGWDYIAVNKGKLYVAHSTQVNIVNEFTGDSVGVIPNTTGVHGIAFDNTLNRGYTSNGRLNNVTVFDLSTNAVITQIPTGENPDAILYEPYSKTIITCNGRSGDLSVIDTKNNSVVATIAVGGKPEAAATNGGGKLYVNIEDKSEIAEVDMKTFSVVHHWSVAPGASPAGLAIDTKTKRLFSGCGNKLLMVLDAVNGHIVSKLPIGNGCDGVVFDARTNRIFASNGEGTITAIQEQPANDFTVIGNYKTSRGARTIAIDENTGTLFLPTANYEATMPAGGRPKIIPGTFKILVVH